MVEPVAMGTDDFADNPIPRAAAVLLLDCSSSMQGRPIDELNAALAECRVHLLANVMAAKRAEIAVVTSGSVNLAIDFADADHFNPPILAAGGRFMPDDAIALAIKMVDERKQQYRRNDLQYYKPGIFLITRGIADVATQQAATAMIKPGETAKAFAFFAVGVGDADMESLARISGRPPVTIAEMGFVEFFV